MKLTKFQHACFTLEKDGATLVVDPGVFSHDFIAPKRVDGIIITHEHPDHLDPALMQRLIAEHPKATIIAHSSITSQFAQSPTLTVNAGEPQSFGPFTLQFFGGIHAPIADGVDVPPNLGILIDESLYYPGDSFAVPEGVSVQTLALPVSAPWLNFAQVRNFLAAVKPELVFPTHDGILSEDGKQLAEQMVGGFAHSQGILYKRLDGESIDL